MIKKNLLVIIPARGGSTSLKFKNIKNLGGKPLIYYSLLAAKAIKEISKKIICSTDNKKIANIAKTLGYEVPFLRPKNISGKYATDITFVNHAIKYFFNNKICFKFGLILRPTSPFRDKKTLNTAYKIFSSSNFSSMRAVTKAPITPYRIWKKEGNEIKPIIKTNLYEHYNIPRQKLPKTFFQTGNFEFFKINFKSNIKSVSGKKIYGYIVNGLLKVDIDLKKDLDEANKLFRQHKNFIK